jgi:hypothetical protein
MALKTFCGEVLCMAPLMPAAPKGPVARTLRCLRLCDCRCFRRRRHAIGRRPSRTVSTPLFVRLGEWRST